MSLTSLKPTISWLMSIGLVFGLYMPHLHADAAADATQKTPIQCALDNIFCLEKWKDIHAPKHSISNAIRIAFALFVFYSLYRLYTKKPSNEIAYPEYDPSLLVRAWRYIKYLYDEKILGMIGKPERPDHLDYDTGKIVYAKIKERGAMGTMATYWKDLIIPVMTFAVIWKTFFEKTLPETATATKCVLGID